MEGLDGTHSSFPVLVTQVVTNGIGFSTRAEQRAEVALSLNVLEREQQQNAEQHHCLSHPLVIPSPT